VSFVVRAADLSVHFYRERIDPDDRRSPYTEVDFVAERTDGTVFPVEVKFCHRISGSDPAGMKRFIAKHRSRWGIVVTRDTFELVDGCVLLVPLRKFVLAY